MYAHECTALVDLHVLHGLFIEFVPHIEKTLLALSKLGLAALVKQCSCMIDEHVPRQFWQLCPELSETH
jgi:hypothetical protein